MFTRKIQLHPTHIPHRNAGDSSNLEASMAEGAQLPQTQTPAATAYEDVCNALHLTADRQYDLATFRHSWQEPEFGRLIQQLSKQTATAEIATLERRCLNMLGDLFHTSEPSGAAVASRAQAVQLAGLAMLWNWRRYRRSPGQRITRPNIVWGREPSSAWADFARIFEIEQRGVPTRDGRCLLDVERAVAQVDANTIGVVGVLGNDVSGNYDPLAELDAALTPLDDQAGRPVPIHVDAVGGFVAPFLTSQLRWDFRLPHVQSIHVSGGGYGMVQPAAEWVLWRDRSQMPDGLRSMNHPGNPPAETEGIVAQYYSFLRLGRDGYTRIMRQLQDLARMVADGMSATGRFEILSDGQSLPLVCARMRTGVQYRASDVSQGLQERGWLVPAIVIDQQAGVEVLRIVVGEGLQRSRVEALLKDLRRVLKTLDRRPPRRTQRSIEQELLHDAAETLRDLSGIRARIPLTSPARVS